MSRFPFRVIKASWGIAIDLDVTIATTQPEPGDVWIDDDLWLRIGHDCGKLRWPDVPFLQIALGDDVCAVSRPPDLDQSRFHSNARTDVRNPGVDRQHRRSRHAVLKSSHGCSLQRSLRVGKPLLEGRRLPSAGENLFT